MALLSTLIKNKQERTNFYKKHNETIKYIIFGFLACVVSFVSYYVFRIVFPNSDSVPEALAFIYKLSGIFGADSNTALPVILSWVVTVTFAYFTNRYYVFAEKAKSFTGIIREIFLFYSGRIFTLFVDMAIMFLLIDLPQIYGFFYEFIIKSFCAFVVTVLNYIISKFFIFKKASKKSEKEV